MGAKDKSSGIERELRGMIASGRYKHGELFPTELELARRYGVSRMTLRKALDGLKRAGLLDSSRGAGSFVRAVRRDQIAVIGHAKALYSGQGFFFLKLMESLSRLVEDDGFNPVAHFIDMDDGSESCEILLKLMTPERLESCAGMVSMSTGTQRTGRLLQSFGVPVVGHSIGIPVLDDCVVLDYGAALDLVVDAMKRAGSAKTACLHWLFPETHLVPGCMHYELDRLLRARMGGVAELVPVPYSINADESFQIFKDLWNDKARRPGHVFFADDSFCVHACRAIAELGIEVPGQMELFTLGNKGRAFDASTPLTVVGFDPEEVAMAEWDILKWLMNGGRSGRIVRLAPVVIQSPSIEEGVCR